jgi:hypothetical protein
MKFRKKFFLNAETQMMMGQIFNEMKTANHIVFLLDIKKALKELFMSTIFIFFLAAFINYFTIKEKEIAIQIPFTRRYMASKISAFDK